MFGCYLLEEACSFPMKDRKRVRTEGKEYGEELGRVEGRKIIIVIYCLRKESIFNKKFKK